MKFLIIEDDQDTQRLIQHSLKELTTDFDCCSSSDQALQKLETNNYGLIILDLNLENSHGREILKYLTVKKQNTPVVILSGSSSLDDRIEGLGLGADDFVIKPFSAKELQLRAAGIIRRTRRYTDILEVGNIKLNRLKREVYCYGEKTDFQTREFKVLEYFMSNPDKLIPKDVLISEVWGLDFSPQTNVVDVMICRVRAKIEKKGFTKQLETVRGGGYIFRSFTMKEAPPEAAKKPFYSSMVSWP